MCARVPECLNFSVPRHDGKTTRGAHAPAKQTQMLFMCTKLYARPHAVFASTQSARTSWRYLFARAPLCAIRHRRSTSLVLLVWVSLTSPSLARVLRRQLSLGADPRAHAHSTTVVHTAVHRVCFGSFWGCVSHSMRIFLPLIFGQMCAREERVGGVGVRWWVFAQLAGGATETRTRVRAKFNDCVFYG